jgi:hypothetical protein
LKIPCKITNPLIYKYFFENGDIPHLLIDDKADINYDDQIDKKYLDTHYVFYQHLLTENQYT